VPPLACIVVVGYSTPTVPFGSDVGVTWRPATTVTFVLAPVKPAADAVIAADPIPTPEIWADTAGVVVPASMKTEGDTMTFEVSALSRVTVTPPAGAADTRVTANGCVCPVTAIVPDGSVMAPSVAAVTVAEPLTYPEDPALMVVVPDDAPVTVNEPVLPLGMLMLAGKLTIPTGTADRLTVIPPVGTGALSVMVPVTVFVMPTAVLLSVSVMFGSVTFTVPDPG